MILRAPNSMSLLIFFVIISLVLAYSTIGGVRFILLPIFLLGCVFAFNLRNVLYTLDLSIIFYLFIYVLICSVAIDSYNVFFSVFVFIALSYWPHLVGYDNRLKVKYATIVKAYLFGATICSLGVIVQAYVYNTFGIEFGKIDFYYQRTGFGFLWLDYSFLSLFLVSAIPLVASIKSNSFKIIVCAILLLGSLSTSARTGVFSLLIVSSIFVFIYFCTAVYSGKIKAIWLILFLLGFFSILSLPIIWSAISDRPLTVDSSGRFEGYIAALDISLNSPILGMLFNTDLYTEKYGAIPHNVFIYMLTFGGAVGTLMFSLWLILIAIKTAKVPLALRFSFLTIIVGVQFIPSFFSAYFIAVLVSLVLFKNLETVIYEESFNT